MGQNILLIEPPYKCKFPPIGLMKIAQYHKLKGDNVEFIKGLSYEKRDKFEWDRAYVSTLFTYNWKETVKTIKFYRYCVKEPICENYYIGGVLATLMADELRQSYNCRIISGLLNEKGKLGFDDDDEIDSIIPDYSLLDQVDYNYPLSNAFFVHSTRGCIRKCSFCAVPIIEPHYIDYISIERQVEEARRLFGDKKDLILMDNNLLASNSFERIIREIKNVGFEKDSYYVKTAKNGHPSTSRRTVDFNQGVDVRLLDEGKMSLISETAINPLRIAFDDIKLKNVYIEKVNLAAKHGISNLSNYILFNYTDDPIDFYNRLRINVELNESLGLQIYSFPMRYIDIKSKDRSMDTEGNVGKYWNKKYLRAIQCILLSSRGVVGPKKGFFEAAFGKDIKTFEKILLMPEDYIINREARGKEGLIDKWWKDLMNISESERDEVLSIVKANYFNGKLSFETPIKHKTFLEHYMSSQENGVTI